LEHIESFEKNETIVHSIQVEVNREDFYAVLYPYFGRQYGYLNVFGMGIQRLLKVFGIKIKNPLKDKDKTFVCSELVIRLLQQSSDYCKDLDPERDGPADLYKSLKVK